VDHWHSLLRRQLKRCSIDVQSCPPSVQAFLGLVHEAYRQSDTDRAMLERSVQARTTELASSNEALRQLRQSQKMEAIGRLAGGIAHDFNNLLTAIHGYSEMLLEEMEDDPRREALFEIRRAAERAGGLTKQLLAFGRRQLLSPTILDPNKLIDDINALLRRVSGENVNLVTSLGASVGCLNADKGQLEQVILNLVVNARDAMPKGGRITLETFDLDVDDQMAAEHVGLRPGDYVVVRVTDTGVGMDAEIKAHIFEPFFTTKDAGKGAGLGLATVYGIVKQSNGYIAVKSERGQGAEFTVFLPRVEGRPKEEPAAAPAIGSDTGSEVILLAEDEVGVRDIAREVLQRNGYRVIEASNGAEAFEAASRVTPIDLVLTDVVMPEMNGRELAEQLWATRPSVRVLFMSGYTDDAILTHGLNASSIPLLHKPFTPNALLSAVREAFDGHTCPEVR
jgi:signal transduction histidine kinase/ActR/RegA family two-component response regulator